MKKFFVMALLLVAGAAMAAPVSFTDDLNKLLSRLQVMGGGSYSQADWKEVDRQIDGIESRAKAGEAWDALVQVRVIRAMVLGDMQKNYRGAIDLLQETRRELRGKNVPEMRRVFVSLAGMYGKAGDEDAVNRTMEEFRASPYYDPEQYQFTGGNGPKDPLLVVRPGSAGNGSISETAMKVAQTQARFGAGAEFPDFDLTDSRGVSVTRQSFSGKVVLYDFWNRNWTAWKNDLPNLSGVYSRHKKQGFEVVGISLDPNASDVAAFCQANNMAWTLIMDGKGLPKQLGIFGDCQNFLVDKNGAIIGRNLHGADLIEAVKRALAK